MGWYVQQLPAGMCTCASCTPCPRPTPPLVTLQMLRKPLVGGPINYPRGTASCRTFRSDCLRRGGRRLLLIISLLILAGGGGSSSSPPFSRVGPRGEGAEPPFKSRRLIEAVVPRKGLIDS